MMSRRALLLVNRHCRGGLVDPSEIGGLLERCGVDAEIMPIDDPALIGDVIRARRDKIDLVVLAGGDGTLNAAAEALIDTALPMGIVPLGTANDLARTLMIPAALPEACQVIGQGLTHRIDVGCVNDTLFYNVASIGLPVEVSRRLTPEVKRKWGVLSYAIAAVRAIRESRPFRAEIHVDGEVIRVKTVQISVGNGRHYGGGMTVDEEAAIDDHLLHLYCLKPRHLLRYALLFWALRRGTHKRAEGVLALSGREFAVFTRRSKPVNTDGELTTWTPARFHVLPAAVSVIVPEGYLANQGGRGDPARRVGSSPQ